MRTHTVYKGEKNGKLIYIGTTIQVPTERFRWHKYNGKDLDFTVLSTHTTPEAMLDEEWRLIQLHKPKMNKITKRKQNFNGKLSQEELDARKGITEWCQCCLRRRVNKGYTKCMYCEKVKL